MLNKKVIFMWLLIDNLYTAWIHQNIKLLDVSLSYAGVNSIIAHPPPPPPPPATPPGICMHYLHRGRNLSSVVFPGGWELCSSQDITRVFDPGLSEPYVINSLDLAVKLP